MSILNSLQNLNDNKGNKIKYNYIFLFVLIIFAILKIKYLNTPYHWDEGGVYAPGILKMIDEHTIGLTPNSLVPLYSRGHPLIFYFLAASFMYIFGDSHIVAHIFSLLVGLLTLGTIFFVFSRIVEKLFALLLCILIMFLPLFFSLSGMLLPEMMLTLFSVFIFYSLWFQKWFLYFLFGSMAMFTKESAIVWVVFAIFTIVYQTIENKERTWKLILLNIFYSLTPILVFALFLCIQKYQNGWYFFPEHIGYINLQWKVASEVFARCINMLFISQGKYILLCISIFFFAIQIFLKGFSSIHIKWVVYILVLIFGSTLFASINFLLMRYLLYVYPFVIALMFLPIYTVLFYYKNKLSYNIGLILLVALFISIFFLI